MGLMLYVTRLRIWSVMQASSYFPNQNGDRPSHRERFLLRHRL